VTPPGGGRRKSLAYALVPPRVAKRLAVPRGAVGWVSGRLMVALNADMNATLVDMLDLRGDERVLEVGYGPGVAIALLADRLPAGFIAGVDPSTAMLRQATRRNRTAVGQGRVDLRLGTASELRWPEGHFDVVCSVNAVQLFALDDAATEIRRVLRPGGRLAVGVHEWAADGLADDVPSALAMAGFQSVEATRLRHRSGESLYFHALA
jgi:SAM-dependent methyltransferase